jgi:thymidylate synthase
MRNLVLITSVVNTPNKPLSYSNVRSVFSREERFEQTKKTIQSVKEKIPNHKIIIVECTDFTEEELNYFKKECDYVLNLWDRKELHDKIFGTSKALGEGTMTIQALQYMIKNKFEYKNLFKICGRYWLNNDFNYEIFDNSNIMFKKIRGNINNIFTSFYKIPNNNINILLDFLIKTEIHMKNKIGYEVLFGHYLKHIKYDSVVFVNKIGYEGQVTVCGTNYIG